MYTFSGRVFLLLFLLQMVIRRPRTDTRWKQWRGSTTAGTGTDDVQHLVTNLHSRIIVVLISASTPAIPKFHAVFLSSSIQASSGLSQFDPDRFLSYLRFVFHQASYHTRQPVKLIIRRTQLPGARPPWGLNFVRWRPIFVGPKYGTFSMPPFWYL